MSLWIPDLLVAGLGTVLAALEVQIEGPHGWAEKLPTWRPDGPIARFASRALGGKTITGYHLLLNVFLLGMVHLPLAFLPWTLQLEGWALSRFAFLLAFWDLQWFALNPHYGLARFDRERVTWHRRWVGRVPVDYLYAIGLAALLGAWWPSDWLTGLIVFTGETIAVCALGEWLLRNHPARRT